ncbi:MAG: hypothetical protein H0T17_02785 [Propionibacteriales bacterium]|nr:hypothetical protein [Propionibacteriales bacterium]
MAIDETILSRADLPDIVATLMAWEGEASYPLGLHVGDVGWHARLPDDELDGTMRAFSRNGVWVAFGLFEPGLVRPRIAPGLAYDAEVARAVADAVQAMPQPQVCTDADPGSAFRTWLSAAGWTLDPDPWTCLYKPLDSGDRDLGDSATKPPADADGVCDRVAVQRAAFTGSTFTVEAWQRMATGPGFDPDLEMLSRDDVGRPVAGRDRLVGRGRKVRNPRTARHPPRPLGAGHGRRVLQALLGALGRAGCSGVSVHTPARNAAAVAVYTSSGMRAIENTQTLIRPKRLSVSAARLE